MKKLATWPWCRVWVIVGLPNGYDGSRRPENLSAALSRPMRIVPRGAGWREVREWWTSSVLKLQTNRADRVFGLAFHSIGVHILEESGQPDREGKLLYEIMRQRPVGRQV